jgi:hypothetical protein
MNFRMSGLAISTLRWINKGRSQAGSRTLEPVHHKGGETNSTTELPAKAGKRIDQIMGHSPVKERAQRKASERTARTKRQTPVCSWFFLDAHFLFSVLSVSLW